MDTVCTTIGYIGSLEGIYDRSLGKYDKWVGKSTCTVGYQDQFMKKRGNIQWKGPRALTNEKARWLGLEVKLACMVSWRIHMILLMFKVNLRSSNVIKYEGRVVSPIGKVI